MSETLFEIKRLDAEAATELAPQLVELLRDAVASGASLGFWNPLGDEMAQAYWRDVCADVARGHRRLLAALRDGELLGSVQLDLPTKQNARRRAEVQKLMTHRLARRQGVGRELMRAIEQVAYDEGRTLLVLDTAGTEAERLYRSLGYQEVGVIPRYTVEADGAQLATMVFYKSLNAS
ncbi:MAG TPA: GNAT family N-acetyltransferase [Ktedonobacterales bacterium]|nr:GNAT family N-acetyltransferase [Ktedonobacterales bacterium]